jgi:3-oxoacyl-[acyl-carrier-protein] synthase-1
MARRLIASGRYHTVVVAGADTLSRFVYTGFHSFQALGSGRCKPFSVGRDGINAGEAAAVMVISSKYALDLEVLDGAITNDANHISGPSRTGEELAHAITLALQRSGRRSTRNAFISAHGTATLFNDEMESRAFGLCNLNEVPVNSIKGSFGHTFGTAGILESVMSVISMREQKLLPTVGFTSHGVPVPLNIVRRPISAKIDTCIKTASGFGGCNAALVFATA